ncbi:hypothetical protein Vretimale_7316 [Volvox reticuliferus]|uniref:Uncharacterized protein n=1 Tax=Volvox reticuliferus TaxID=1737510 RepID=A0A8J4D1G6_9CHLO|nr:hypothetical protein Vretifemale_19404 [Volvox reticuliferus]GIM02466.1 hypothetical protein Vretimale_7316 [Volvox reticuliferus]
MDTIFTLPLFILAVLQAFITVLHAIPGVGLPLSQTLRLLTQNTASRSVIYTLMGALALLSTSSLYELSKGADKVRSGTLRGYVKSVLIASLGKLRHPDEAREYLQPVDAGK